MIKKLIGILVAVAVIAVIVIVFLRRDKFESMIRRDELPGGVRSGRARSRTAGRSRCGFADPRGCGFDLTVPYRRKRRPFCGASVFHAAEVSP